MFYDTTATRSLKTVRANSFTKQKQTQKHRQQTWLPKGKAGRDKLGVWGYQVHATVYKVDLLYSRRNYGHCLVIIYNGK